MIDINLTSQVRLFIQLLNHKAFRQQGKTSRKKKEKKKERKTKYFE